MATETTAVFRSSSPCILWGVRLGGRAYMRYNVGLPTGDRPVVFTLEELELHKIVVSRTYPSGSLDFHGTDFSQASPLNVDATAELVGGEIRVRGHLSVRLGAACDRCLKPTEVEVKLGFDLTYRPLEEIAKEEEIEVPADELDVGFYSGDGIALADIVTEQVILAMPMKVVCRSDCQGLCPVCGADRNHVKCQCPPPKDDSPFASLKGN